MQTVTLTHGKWELALAPELGGSIALCRYDGQDMLRPAASVPKEARDTSCFPLVPFSNRIENGLFEFQGQRVHLPPNMGDHPHAIHGQSWRGEWKLVAEMAGKALLAYHHEADAWPWTYHATQEFELAGDSLSVRLAITNLTDRPMPVGLGLHPYFPRGDGAVLTTGVTHLWDATGEQIPIQRIDLPEAMNFARGLKIAELDLDHCFAGWNGKALIEWSSRAYRLWMEGDRNLSHLVVYTPPGQDFFCVEGVENMNNAVNWLTRDVETGLKILSPAGSPDSSHSATTVFRAEAVPA